jgi:hypothetical protein
MVMGEGSMTVGVNGASWVSKGKLGLAVRGKGETTDMHSRASTFRRSASSCIMALFQTKIC